MRIDRFEVSATRRPGSLIDLDVDVDCSSGTYIRALARDLGNALGVGGHLTSLRRTRVGRFGLDQARTLEELVAQPRLSWTLDDACLLVFPRRVLTPTRRRRPATAGRCHRPESTVCMPPATTPAG